MRKSENKREFENLRKHIGHKITLKQDNPIGEPPRATIQCETCNCCITDTIEDEPLFDKIAAHYHPEEDTIVCVCYGIKGQTPANIAIECELHNEVIFDIDRDYAEETIVEKVSRRKP